MTIPIFDPQSKALILNWDQTIEKQIKIKLITNRDPSQLSMETLKTILEQGDAAWVARQMIKKKKIFRGFVKLLLHETWIKKSFSVLYFWTLLMLQQKPYPPKF